MLPLSAARERTPSRIGHHAQADGGILFLDEICELEMNLQAKLLRLLQSGTVQKVGSDTLKKVDVRIVCTTNRDPLEEVEAGRFREDLYYRLHVLPIGLPPLRARRAVILELARHLVLTCPSNFHNNQPFAPVARCPASRCGMRLAGRTAQNHLTFTRLRPVL